MRAGFLCDVMGLGKTLETLMLVLANSAPPDWAVSDLAKAPPRKSKEVRFTCSKH